MGQKSHKRWKRRLALGLGCLAAVLLGLGVFGYRVSRALLATKPYPESATGLRPVPVVSATSELVVAADPQAARAARAQLARGGTALDAALAAQLVLGLVEPQSSGPGGGAFLLYWDAVTKTLHAYDGREVAPAGVEPELFMQAGQPLSFPVALIGGRAVGVPGVLRMLELAHARHASLSWRSGTEEALRLARDGFHVSRRLATLIALDPVLPTLQPTRVLFTDPKPAAGAKLKNPEYAATMATLGERGADGLYTGRIAGDIVKAVQSARQPSLVRGLLNLVRGELGLRRTGEATVPAPGALSLGDLAAYTALERQPLCERYREYRVCSMPPPASGLSVLHALALLNHFPLASYAPLSVPALHLLAEAQRLAFADRDAYLADPSHANVPLPGLLEASYVQGRAAQITLQRALAKAQPGRPRGASAALGAARSPEQLATSHFSIVDRMGNIASMTSSIEFAFGSHLMVDGMLLNNQLTDFSFQPEQAGVTAANAVAAGKRPRSAMSPTIIFDAESGEPVAVVGSPGGPAIVGYVVQTIVALLDWKLSPQAAVALPHVINRNRDTELEDVGWPSSETRDAAARGLEALGHEVSFGSQNSGLHVIWLGRGKLEAGVDPRREGAALGE